MSKKNGRKLFSQKDGTTFIEDIHDISDDVRTFFNHIPPHLKKWIATATDVVDFIEKISDALEDGQPADTVIDFILKDHPELQVVYEKIKDAIELFISDARYQIEQFGVFTGEDKMNHASASVADISGLSAIESDTVTQLAVYFYKG